MHRRIVIPLLTLVTALAAIFTFIFLLTPIQAAPVGADTQAAIVPNTGHDSEHFAAFLSGDQEVPAVSTAASGVARFTLSEMTLEYEVAVRDISNITASHIHMGAVGVNGGVVFPLYTGTGDFDPDNPISGTLMLTEDQVNELRAGNYYVNVHTAGYPSGEIRGQITAAYTTAYETALSGAKEVGSVDSRASGQAFLTLSADMMSLHYRVLLADIDNVAASHIHEAPPGENGPVIFTLFAGSGDFDPQNPVSGVLSPTITQVSTLLAGDYYVNVHTSEHPAGEIRGQIAPFSPRADAHALLTGDQEVPAVETTGVGVGRFELSDDLATLNYTVAVDDISDITASHLHTAQPGENGGVAHTLFDGSGTFEPGAPISGALPIDAQSVLDLVSGNYYVNVHTTSYPGGEIRGQVGGVTPFAALLTGDQEVPAVPTAASGRAIMAVNDDASALYYRVMVEDIAGITASHIHNAPAGANGGVVFPLYTGSGDFDPDNPISGMVELTDENIFDLLAGDYYVNVHTDAYPAGEIRGQLGALEPAAHYQAQLTGGQELPPVPTAASGQGYFTLDDGRSTLHYFVAVSDINDITASHIHVGPAGQNGPPVFTLFSGEGDFNPDQPIGSGIPLQAENLVDLLTGFYYVNVHTTSYPSGEIRGQIGPPAHLIYMPVIMK